MQDDITVFIGLDVHKDSIAVAVAEVGREAARFVGTCGPKVGELLKTLAHLGEPPHTLLAYSISDDTDQLDLFVSLYAGVDEPTPIPDSETKVAAERCLRFLTLCAEGKMAQRLDQSSDVASLANTLQHIYIAWLKGLQIVNGGQTTASLYFTKKKYPDTDLSRVRVPAKIIVMKAQDSTKEEALVSDISRYANSQNAVRQSDLSANKPFHVEIEKLSRSVYCPDGVGQWFYERAAGSYNTLLSREGTTPARLKALKDAIPTARRITKTDLAKYLNAWDRKPDIVSMGSQKNFDRFMAALSPADGQEVPLPTVADYKAMIAKAKLYREAQKMLRPMFQAFQANVTAYTISVLSEKLGARIDLDRIWAKQAVSPELMEQIATWAKEVNDTLHSTSGGRMVSEWAKRPECKDAVMGASYSEPADDIPEVKAA